MSLATLESAILQLVVDALEDCDLTVPDEAIRHHGPLPSTPGCCTEAGILSIGWDESPKPADCGVSEWALVVRWMTCWPHEINPIDYPGRDATTVRITDVTECVEAALSRAVCNFGTTSPLFSIASMVKIGRTTPIPPGGKCAGVLWRLTVIPRPTTSPS